MFKKVLVPLDGSLFAEQALSKAAIIARKLEAAVHLVLVHPRIPYAGFEDVPWYTEDSAGEREYLASIAAGSSLSSLAVTSTVLRGDPAPTICTEARESGSDLIVMASHGRTGLSRTWIGSVAHDVIRHSGVPVLLVRPSEQEQTPAEESGKIQRILVTLDGSDLSEEIIPAAAELARCHGASIIALRVVQPVAWMPPITSLPLAFSPGAYDEDLTKNLVAAAERDLQIATRELEKDATIIETSVIVAESTAHAILEMAKANRADVIAMATHGRGASRVFLGSVTDKVLRGSEAMMLLQCPSSRRMEGLTRESPENAEVRSA